MGSHFALRLIGPGWDLTICMSNRGVITHLEPDILECEVKWALESITMSKASGGDAS